MLTKTGIKILDFRLAKLFDTKPVSAISDAPTRQKDLTREQAIVGTLPYMAPGQLEGKSVDARGDIWALGRHPVRDADRGGTVPRQHPSELDLFDHECRRKLGNQS